MLLAQTYTYETTSAGASIVLLLIYAVVGIAVLAFQIWVLMKILGYDEATYTAAGQNRTLWMVLGIVALCGCATIIIDLIWFLAIKPKLDQAQSGGAYGGAPPPAYG